MKKSIRQFLVYSFELIIMVAFITVAFERSAFASFDYSEFSKNILRGEVYEEYKKEADSGDIEAIVHQMAKKPHTSGNEYVEITKRMLKPEIYEAFEQEAYEGYDKNIKPLPKIKNTNGKEIIDIQKVRTISKNNEIAAFRQAYIAGAIELAKRQYTSDKEK